MADQSDKPDDKHDDKQAPIRATGMKRGPDLVRPRPGLFAVLAARLSSRGAGYTDKALNRPGDPVSSIREVRITRATATCRN